MTHEQFIEKLKIKNPKFFEEFEIIGNYISSTDKIEVSTKYGICEVTPSSLLMGSLPTIQSAINPTDYFIHQSKEVHANKYLYNNVKYITIMKKVTITCLKHGDFEQIPITHLKGSGCNKCAGQLRNKSKLLTTESFILRANKIHTNKYLYDKVEYIDIMQKVIITCPVHGHFHQAANGHLQGYGCRKCSDEMQTNKKTLTTNIFIEKAKIKHGDTYSYEEVNYQKGQKCTITCKIHGSFKQRPNDHLSGKGCFKCARLKIGNSHRDNPRGWSYTDWENSAKISENFESYKLYIVRLYNNEESFFKIGKTYVSLHKRITIGINMYSNEVIKVITGTAKYISELEKELQKKNTCFRYTPKQVFGGRHECYTSIDNLDLLTL